MLNDIDEIERRYIRNRANFLPWEAKSPAARVEFEEFKRILSKRAGAIFFGENSYVSPDAHVYTERFSIGRNSWVASGAIIRGYVSIGEDSTVNPFARIAGSVQIGNGVRIGGLASIYGFSHGHARADVPIFAQPQTSKGVVICDDVWIGTNVVIVDGVTVAAHSIVGGGAVVTRDFPEYSIIGGNPARVLKNRL